MVHTTRQQRETLYKKWEQDANGMTYREFRKSVIIFDFGAIGVQWCGMWVGIEQDGHAHT